MHLDVQAHYSVPFQFQKHSVSGIPMGHQMSLFPKSSVAVLHVFYNYKGRG